MNLQWAWEHELYDLYDLTVRRIIYEYREVIMKQFAVSIPNERSLLAILGELKGDERIKALMWIVIETYQRMNVKSQEELQIQKKLVQGHNNVKETNENSLSYKVGRFITWVPRKVKRIILRAGFSCDRNS